MGFKFKAGKLGGKLGSKSKLTGVFGQAAAAVGDDEDEAPPVIPPRSNARPGLPPSALPGAIDAEMGIGVGGVPPAGSVLGGLVVSSPAGLAAAQAAARLEQQLTPGGAAGAAAAAIEASAVSAALKAAVAKATSCAQALSQACASSACASSACASSACGVGAAPSAGAGTSADDDAEPLDLIESSRGNYTFCKRYDTSRYLLVDECTGLHSIDMYENLGIVGRGAFNKIYKAKHRKSGELVALKALQLQALGEGVEGEGLPLEMMREMSILMSLRHPNVVSVREVVVDSAQMFMVMELVDFDLGLLIEHMKQPFSEGQVYTCIITPSHTHTHTITTLIATPISRYMEYHLITHTHTHTPSPPSSPPPSAGTWNITPSHTHTHTPHHHPHRHPHHHPHHYPHHHPHHHPITTPITPPEHHETAIPRRAGR